MKHFRLHIPDTGREIYTPRKSQDWGYRYGPSIMCHDHGICEAWFASPGDSFEADWFTYRRSEDGGKTWTEERVVMSPVPDSMDRFSVCDPAVIRYGDYYYMGYTSTIFTHNGGVCNNGFIARSLSPTGPFERWTGTGWGETRTSTDGTVCHWLGKPAPVIYYDEPWQNWGAGEFSFVIKDETLYIYYTWTSRDRDGRPMGETRVATADITREDWPATVTPRGTAVKRPRPWNDSYDVVYCEDLDKFIALSTDLRFSENSYLAVCESDDGITFTRVGQNKVNTGWMLHNCGISGDAHHHIKTGDTLLLAYAYGNQWGCWGTRLHEYTFTLEDADFYDESMLPNVHHHMEKLDDPVTYTPTMLYLAKPHYLSVKVGDTVEIPMMTGNVAYAMRPAENVSFSNYDKDICTIEGMTLTAVSAGYSYVRAHMGELCCEFLVYTTEGEPDAWCPWQPYPEKEVVDFKPLITHYTASLSKREMKQIRGLATYADASWFEVCGDDGVTYVNHAPALFDILPNGCVLPTGELGQGRITVQLGNHAFDVCLTVEA